MRCARRACMVLLLISVSALSCTSTETIVVKKSSVEKDVITVDGGIDGKSVQLMCFMSVKNCREIPDGVYSFIRVTPGKGIYTDCPNIDIYVKDSNDKKTEQVSEYCLLGN